MLQKAIDDFREKRISELEYLQQTEFVKDSVVNRRGDNIPDELRDNEDAQAFFGILRPLLAEQVEDGQALYQISIAAARSILDIIQQRIIRDWRDNDDIKNDMRNTIDDYLYDVIIDQHQVDLSAPEMDQILNESIRLAENRLSFHQ
mgnify:FL=1